MSEIHDAALEHLLDELEQHVRFYPNRVFQIQWPGKIDDLEQLFKSPCLTWHPTAYDLVGGNEFIRGELYVTFFPKKGFEDSAPQF